MRLNNNKNKFQDSLEKQIDFENQPQSPQRKAQKNLMQISNDQLFAQINRIDTSQIILNPQLYKQRNKMALNQKVNINPRKNAFTSRFNYNLHYKQYCYHPNSNNNFNAINNPDNANNYHKNQQQKQSNYKRNMSTQIQRKKYLNSVTFTKNKKRLTIQRQYQNQKKQTKNQDNNNYFDFNNLFAKKTNNFQLFSIRNQFKSNVGKQLKPISPSSFYIVDERKQSPSTKFYNNKLSIPHVFNPNLKLMKNMKMYHKRRVSLNNVSGENSIYRNNKSIDKELRQLIEEVQINPSMSYIKTKSQIISQSQKQTQLQSQSQTQNIDRQNKFFKRSNNGKINEKNLNSSNSNSLFTTRKILENKLKSQN